MNERIKRKGAAIIIALALAIPMYILLEVTPIQIAWLIVWLLAFSAIVDENYSLLTRGLLFLLISVTLSMLGIAYARNSAPEWLWLVEYIGNIMVLTGAGVGANFISQHFLSKREKT